MGLFSKKKKTVVNQTTTGTTSGTSTTTPNLPDWVTNPLQALSTKTSDVFGATDPTKLIAGPTSLQTQAATSAAGLKAPDAFKQASDILNGAGTAGASAATAGSIANNIDPLLNKFLPQLLSTGLEEYDFGAGQARAGDTLARAGDTTFGGSGGAIQTALSNARLAAGRGKLAADISGSAYDRAGALAGQQAGYDTQTSITNATLGEQAMARKLAAGQALTNLGGAQGANDRANIGTQFDLGEALRGITNDQNASPIDTLLKEIAARSGIPYDLFKGVTTNTTGNTSETTNGTSTTKSSGLSFSDLAKIAQAAAIAASDGRLKQDIETVGYDDKGRRWVDFSYVWDPDTRHRGVIAQEVQKTDPDAVFMHPAGFLMVDYGAL